MFTVQLDETTLGAGKNVVSFNMIYKIVLIRVQINYKKRALDNRKTADVDANYLNIVQV